MKENILNLNLEEFECSLNKIDISKTHSNLIFNHIYKFFNLDFDFNKEYTNNKKQRTGRRLKNLISKNDIDSIKTHFDLGGLVEFNSHSSSDGTIKKIFKTHDGQLIESVIIPHKHSKFTFCISSQIGCAMGCKFCVTGKNGLFRNLSTSEIVNQVLLLCKVVKPTAIVFMGQGEPITNYNNVKKAIQLLTSTKAFNFSAKKITVSTSGLIPGLIKLHKETGIKMAYSLNATNQIDRSRIMKVNDILDFETGINQLKDYLFEINKNKNKFDNLMIEYVMFKDFNDGEESLNKLIQIAKELKYCFINLIPYNEHEFAYADFDLIRSERAEYFHKNLVENDIRCFERCEHGADIYAACGMLSNKD